jgi:hypothetical protein
MKLREHFAIEIYKHLLLNNIRWGHNFKDYVSIEQGAVVMADRLISELNKKPSRRKK